jgi:hypothetical protein
MKQNILSCEKQILIEVKSTPEEYLPNLLQIVRLFRESIVLAPAPESFRQGMQEAMTKDTKPVSELWTGIVAE